MKTSLWVTTLLLMTVGARICHAANTASLLPRSAPEAQGVSSFAVLEFLRAADERIDVMNSFMLVRHGHVIAEGWWAPYNAESNHELYSLSKSFTSTAVGLAVAEGRLSVDDTVMSFFPDAVPEEPSNNLKSMRVRDLLRMAAGHQDEVSSAAGSISAETFLAHPVPHKPGTHFRYNTPATFMLSAIVQAKTGQTVLDYLRPRLFEPLGIENPVWNTNWQGISLGGYGLRVRTEDIARFGQLYLQKGEWHGERLLPAAWVDDATQLQVANGSNPDSDWDQGYGYQFWRCRHRAYRGDGAFGQYCIVLPEQDAVIAITSGVRDMQAVLNLIWEKLLPAFQEGRLPANEQRHELLLAALKGLKVPVVSGWSKSPILDTVHGEAYEFGPNDQKLERITLERRDGGDGVVLKVRVDGRDSRLVCGAGDWVNGKVTMGRYVDEPVSGCVGWGKDGCTIKLCLYETPFYHLWTLRFAEGRLTLETQVNVGFGGVAPVVLTSL